MDNKIALIMIYGIARTVSIIDLVSRSCYLKVYELMDCYSSALGGGRMR